MMSCQCMAIRFQSISPVKNEFDMMVPDGFRGTIKGDVGPRVAVQILRMAARRVLAFPEGQAASTALHISGAVPPAALSLLSAN